MSNQKTNHTEEPEELEFLREIKAPKGVGAKRIEWLYPLDSCLTYIN